MTENDNKSDECRVTLRPYEDIAPAVNQLACSCSGKIWVNTLLQNYNKRRRTLTEMHTPSDIRPKIMSCNRLLKTGLNNVVLPTLFNGCQQYCSALLHLIAG